MFSSQEVDVPEDVVPQEAADADPLILFLWIWIKRWSLTKRLTNEPWHEGIRSQLYRDSYCAHQQRLPRFVLQFVVDRSTGNGHALLPCALHHSLVKRESVAKESIKRREATRPNAWSSPQSARETGRRDFASIHSVPTVAAPTAMANSRALVPYQQSLLHGRLNAHAEKYLATPHAGPVLCPIVPSAGVPKSHWQLVGHVPDSNTPSQPASKKVTRKTTDEVVGMSQPPGLENAREQHFPSPADTKGALISLIPTVCNSSPDEKSDPQAKQVPPFARSCSTKRKLLDADESNEFPVRRDQPNDSSTSSFQKRMRKEKEEETAPSSPNSGEITESCFNQANQESRTMPDSEKTRASLLETHDSGSGEEVLNGSGIHKELTGLSSRSGEKDPVPLSNKNGIERFQEPYRPRTDEGARESLPRVSFAESTLLSSPKDQGQRKRNRKREKEDRKMRKREKKEKKRQERQESHDGKRRDMKQEENPLACNPECEIVPHQKTDVDAQTEKPSRSSNVGEKTLKPRSSLLLKKQDTTTMPFLRRLVTARSTPSSRLDECVSTKNIVNPKMSRSFGNSGASLRAGNADERSQQAPENATADRIHAPERELRPLDRKAASEALPVQQRSERESSKLSNRIKGPMELFSWGKNPELTQHSHSMGSFQREGQKRQVIPPLVSQVQHSTTRPKSQTREDTKKDGRSDARTNPMKTILPARELQSGQPGPSQLGKRIAPKPSMSSNSTGKHSPEKPAAATRASKEMICFMSQTTWSERESHTAAPRQPDVQGDKDLHIPNHTQWQHGAVSMGESIQSISYTVHMKQSTLLPEPHQPYVHGRPQQHPFLPTKNDSNLDDLQQSVPKKSPSNARLQEPVPTPIPDTTLPHATHDTAMTATPIKILCAEEFLERWGQVVAVLASGKWSSSARMAPAVFSEHPCSLGGNRKIVVEDSPLVDYCNVDMELPRRCAVLVVSTSSFLEEEGAKWVVLRIATLAGIRRYTNLYVIVVLDTKTTSSIAQRIFQLQSSIVSFSSCESTHIHFKTSLPQSLAGSIAEVVIGCETAMDDNKSLLEYLSDEQAVERALFLLNLIPTLCVYGVLEILQLTKAFATERSTSTNFGLLFSDQRLRQRIMFAATSTKPGNIHPQAMVQLFEFIRVPLASSGL
ncbi:hypothetical protein ACA910_005831 [Epithemia clementina (nom. ined.)]